MSDKQFIEVEVIGGSEMSLVTYNKDTIKIVTKDSSGKAVLAFSPQSEKAQIGTTINEKYEEFILRLGTSLVNP